MLYLTSTGQLQEEFPQLNAVVHNAGIMRRENLRDQSGGLAEVEATIATNLLGPIRLTAALLPLLQRQPEATFITISSGLAFVPMASAPTYCATKAAIHSYSQSLRYQLKNTRIQVIELIPPYVQTALLGEHQANDPNAMPLDEFIQEVMHLLETQPDASEINVQRVHPLRFAAEGGQQKYDQFFTAMNDQLTAALSGH